MRSRLARWHERCPSLTMAGYSVMSGVVATGAGAAASLLAHGSTPRIAVWVTVTAVMSVAAACVYPVSAGNMDP